MRRIHRREEREQLKQKNKGRSKNPHQRQPIGWPDQHVNQCDRPCQEDDYFKQVRDRTPAEGVPAHRQEHCLHRKAEGNHDEVETTVPKNARAQGNDAPHNRGEKEDR